MNIRVLFLKHLRQLDIYKRYQEVLMVILEYK